MIKNIYPEYKTSKIEWIGEIPTSWEETRMKYIGNLYGGLTGKSGEDFNQEDNTKNKPYIPYTNIFRNTYISKNHVDYVVLEDGENQNKVKKFDLFFLMSSETYQDLGKPCILIDDIEELYLNSFCKGFRVTRNDINPLFLNYQLLGSVHKELISIEGRGFTRINLRQDRLNETPIFLPPLLEQNQIVQFLDEKTELIDKLISTKERKITLLKEKRISLINQVVTKGLNPDVKMKDSGVEWIGDIPEHWSFVNFGRICSVRQGLQIPFDNRLSEKVDNSYEYITTQSVHNPEQYKQYILNPKPNVVCNESDILMGRTGNTGEVVTNVNGVFHNNFFLIDFNREILIKEFLVWYLINPRLREELLLLSGTTTIPDLNHGKFLSTKFIYPNKDEQNDIIEFLDSKTKEIDDLVQFEQKKIDLLKEYRQSLISEVVTGKVKVTQ